MRIAGFQPCTLIDFPGKIAAIIFTQGCPFACTYCHNPELIPHKDGVIEEHTIFAELEKRKGFLDAVVVTGGEPTIHPDLPEFLKKIKALDMLVKLDTNGLHPEMIERIIRMGCVDFFAMDIKQKFAKYRDIVGDVPNKVIEQCERTMKSIAQSGVPYEFRTTTDATIHTCEDLLAIAVSLPHNARYAVQRLRREKTRIPMEAAGEQEEIFLTICEKRIREIRPDIQLILRT